MSTLTECVDSFIANISVTDRQESSISKSVKNLDEHLKNKEAKMGVLRTFTAGSWERDTIIRPLDDVDIFAVLDPDVWKDENGQRSSPQAVLTSMRNYLNGLSDYEDKVSQDRPCVSIQLTDKHIDVLPCFEEIGGGYLMPSADLKFWIPTYPQQLEQDLKTATGECKFVKGTIKAVKHWKREHDVQIPSYHVEEVTITVSRVVNITDHVRGITEWFKRAEVYLIRSNFNTVNAYDQAIKKVQEVKERLAEAEDYVTQDEEDEAIAIWKELFGSDFKVMDLSEAKNFSSALREGTLRVTAPGVLSTSAGRSIPASSGYFGSTTNE